MERNKRISDTMVNVWMCCAEYNLKKRLMVVKVIDPVFPRNRIKPSSAKRSSPIDSPCLTFSRPFIKMHALP